MSELEEGEGEEVVVDGLLAGVLEELPDDAGAVVVEGVVAAGVVDTGEIVGVAPVAAEKCDFDMPKRFINEPKRESFSCSCSSSWCDCTGAGVEVGVAVGLDPDPLLEGATVD
jgi:hypothetical protein